MPHDPGKLLEQMIAAGDSILRFTAGRSRADYSRDDLLRSAVERQFEIVGEALGRLSAARSDLAERVPQRRQIISFRNVLIHGYDSVDDDVVWDVVQNDLRALMAVLQSLLIEVDAESLPP